MKHLINESTRDCAEEAKTNGETDGDSNLEDFPRREKRRILNYLCVPKMDGDRYIQNAPREKIEKERANKLE